MALLAIAKRSRPYRSIRTQVVQPYPRDSWYEDGVAFIAFDLCASARDLRQTEGTVRQAIFALTTAGELVAARLIQSFGDAGGEAAVQDLLVPESGQVGRSHCQPSSTCKDNV